MKSATLLAMLMAAIALATGSVGSQEAPRKATFFVSGMS